MAGVGACIKPHFLLVPVLLLLWRRKIGVAEWSLALAGLIYAVVLGVFFRPYIIEILPSAQTSYAGIQVQSDGYVRIFVLFVHLALAFAIGRRANVHEAWNLWLAALGFALAAVLQGKLFSYHFLPAWLSLLLFLTALISAKSRQMRRLAWGVMLSAVFQMYLAAAPWFRDAEGREAEIPLLLKVIDASQDFAVFSDYPYPAFPTVFYADRPYLGSNACNGAMAAVGMLETGQDRAINPIVRQIAVRQAVTELARHPHLVIVNDDWSSSSGLRSRFDGLAWLDRQPAFHRLWQHYRVTGRIGHYRLFRLVDGPNDVLPSGSADVTSADQG
jgi:hypothetical protein